MKLLLLLCALVFLVLCEASAQEISRINLPLIFETTSNPQSAYYYPSLLRRYQAHDSTMTSVDYSHLYYGYVQQPGYRPQPNTLTGEMLAQLMEQRKYPEAKQLLSAELEKNPVSLCLTYHMAQLAYMQQDFKEERKWLTKFEGLVQAVLESGDGLSENTALVVISPQDEVPVLKILGLTPKASAVTVASRYDLHPLSTPNELEAEKLYFSVEIPQQYSKALLGNTSGGGQNASTTSLSAKPGLDQTVRKN